MNMHDKVDSKDGMGCGLSANASINDSIKAPSMSFHVECIGSDGNVKWEETIHNTVMTEGKTDIVDKYLKGSSYTAAWYLGLKGTGSEAAGDTLASHAGWSEVTPYSGNRPAITWGTTSGGSNTASAVAIAITGTSTVAGAFCATVDAGTSGILYNTSDFAASRSVASGDTLNVTPTISVS
jgi:hypothetical protein